MADKNSSPRKLLFFLFLLFIPTIRLCKSDSPQNIEVYFPPPSPPLPPPPPPSPPTISSSPPEISTLSPESSPVTTSNKKKIAAAVGATAASTLILTGLAFFVIQRMIVAKRKRKIDSPVAGAAGGGGGGGSAMALQSRSQFVRYQGEVKGFIVDENGLDVLYWRKLEKRNADNALRKEVLKKNTKIQEVPLLRERSSTSHLVDDQDGDGDADHGLRVSNHNPQRNGVVFREPEVLSSRSSSISGPPPESLPPTPSPPPTPPPPPIPPPPPPPPAKKALVPPPPVPKLRSVNAGAKPPTAPPAKGKSAAAAAESGGPVKMKALHWDKVNMGNSDHSMVWDKINSQSGSFRFDGDLMEALFGYVATNNNNKRPSDGGEESTANSKTPPRTFILETRKSQNTAIVLRSLNVTRKEIIDALMEGIGLSHDTLERLSRIAPTQEEQTLILEFSGDASRLADADSFLFHLLRAVPSAFARLDAMLFRSVSGPEIAQLRDSVRVLEKACGELRTRGLFVKLLEAVLKAGNRMNAGTSRGNAQAFDLSSLRKLSDVRSTDGKTTLLHFVVSEVVRSEGKRCATGRDGRSGPLMNRSPSMKEERDREYATLGLPIVGGLSSEFSNVKKAAGMDHEGFSSAIPALAKRATQIRRTIVAQSVKGGFAREMEGFLNSIDEELRLVAEEKERALEAVKKTTEYYQAGSSTTANNQPFQLFVVVRDFLTMVDLVCVEIARNMQRKRVPVNSNSNSISNNGISKISKFGNGKYVMPGKIAAPEKFSVRFPNLPANFMSGRSSSSDSDDDDE